MMLMLVVFLGASNFVVCCVLFTAIWNCVLGITHYLINWMVTEDENALISWIGI